jgi:inner membrane protein
MDNITHSLVGLMLSRTGLGGTTPRIGLLMVLASNVPDIDIVTAFGGSVAYLEAHRGYTHALVAAPVMALLPMLAVWRFCGRAYLCSLLCVLTHLLLDWTNIYGVRMLLPFSSAWLRLDITDVIDPWILTLLLFSLGAPWVAKLVTDEVASRRRGGGPSRAWAIFALSALVVYDGARWAAHERALNVLESHMYNGALPARTTATPVRLNPLRWRGVVEGEGFVVLVPVDLSRDFDPTDGRIDYPAEKSPAIDAARKTRPFQAFGSFSQLPFWKLTPHPDGLIVELIDLRFGSPQRPGFVAMALVEPTGIVRDPEFHFSAPPLSQP